MNLIYSILFLIVIFIILIIRLIIKSESNKTDIQKLISEYEKELDEVNEDIELNDIIFNSLMNKLKIELK